MCFILPVIKHNLSVSTIKVTVNKLMNCYIPDIFYDV